MKDRSTSRDAAQGIGRGRPGLAALSFAKGYYTVTCRDRHGRVKWRDTISNLVVEAGLNHTLEVTLAAGTQITSWFLGLTDGAPTVAAGDTMDSHTGWSEVTAYEEANRPAFTPGAVSGQSVDNEGNEADYSINADDTTVGGAFLASDSTKGGSSGTLYSAGAFDGGNKVVDDGDTLAVEFAATQAAA